MDTTEAAELARIILDDSEPDRPNDLYTLTVHEARTLARAVTGVKDLADEYAALARQCGADEVADAIEWENAASLILDALNGDAT